MGAAAFLEARRDAAALAKGDLGLEEILLRRQVADYRAFWESRMWLPIEGYDKVRGPRLLVRSGEVAALAYFGPAADSQSHLWREGTDFRFGRPLSFRPSEYAEIDDEWLARLSRQ